MNDITMETEWVDESRPQESEESECGSDSSNRLSTERTRFANLNPKLPQDVADALFSNFVDQLGLHGIREFNQQLAEVSTPLVKSSYFASSWKAMTTGSLEYAKPLQMTHPLTYGKLVQLAYRLRYPKDSSKDSCNISHDVMIKKLQQPISAVSKDNANSKDLRAYNWSDSCNISYDEMIKKLQQPISVVSKDNANSKDLRAYDWSTEIAQKGFQSEYLRPDILLDPVLKTLREFAVQWRPDRFKAPYTTVVGPTMSGKTRLLMELGKKVPVVYICLRGRASTGLPSRSILADDVLPNSRPENTQLHYSKLLIAILKTVYHFFSKKKITPNNLEDRVTAWYLYSFPKDGKNDDGKFASKVREEMGKLTSLDGSAAIKTLKNMVAKLSSKFGPTKDDRLKIILAFDEARNLMDSKNQPEQVSLFRELRRVLHQIPSNEGFFALFIDTTSRVANVRPTLLQDQSARLHNIGWDLFPPIYRLQTFDVLAFDPTNWNELVSPNRLLSYGTPFYGLYFREAVAQLNAKTTIDQLVMIAKTKLIHTKPILPLSNSQIFAILGSIIQPQLYTAWDLNAELLSSHAAHCMYINPTRDHVFVEYPSQLIYSSAANEFLASSDANWVSCINGLTLAVQEGLVKIGDAGELASRIILICAIQETMKRAKKRQYMPANAMSNQGDSILSNQDESTQEESDLEDSDHGDSISSNQDESTGEESDHEDSDQEQLGKNGPNTGDFGKNPIPYGHPVRLADFLQVLTGKNPFEMDFAPLVDDAKAKLLDEGVIFFNHFIQIQYTPTVHDIMEYLYRGLAVQCKPGQDGIDQLFTIYLKPNSAAANSTCLDVKNITFCGIQVKNHENYVNWKDNYKWTKDFAGIKDITNPYLVILFNLRGAASWKPKHQTIEGGLRALMHIRGLSDLGCLTPEIAKALDSLIKAKTDLMQIGPRDLKTKEWIKSVNPKRYPTSL